VARELAPAAAAAATHSEPEAGRFDSERKKLENAKKAASTASRALQVRQQQWEARRDEWLTDMRAAKRSGQPEASEFLRGIKSTLDDQANALNAEAKKLNKKKKQIRQMTQQLRAIDAEAQADDDADDGAVSVGPLCRISIRLLRACA
jgi:DNA repair ATPase RecN